MRARIPTVIHALVIVVSLAVAPRCLAQPRVQQGEAIGGFGKLSWGVTFEQAREIYRDLYFGSYVVEDDREEPSKIYYRKDENAEIDGVGFDSIQYWFKGNRFHRIKAEMRSRIGPRSLVTRSEESFDRMRLSLVRKYGPPTKYDEGYFIDFVTVTRDAEWVRREVTIVLGYKGPEATNEDRLVFELRAGGKR